jgi:tetratricopeptide (TPR) repeat protein
VTRLLAVLLTLLALAAPARADELFGLANKDYGAGRYDAAIAKYAQLVASGLRHEDLYYNLGNAYFRSAQAGARDRLGLAILSYERALALAPELEDARYNLQVARDLVASRYGQDKVKDAADDPLWVRVATWLPLAMLSLIFLGANVLTFALLIAVRFLASGLLRAGLVVSNVFAAVAVVVLGALLALQVYYVETVHVGLVTVDEVVMREGPDASRREGPKLHAGHRARLLREDHGWVRLRLANQMEGWVPRQSVQEI